MASYYEILGLDPAAQIVEIEQACDMLYEKWHRLVTHHALGDQASQNLKTIETIRATLLDGHARAVYDGGIGVGGVAGLMDPDLLLKQLAPPPMRAARTAQQTTGAPPTDPWACLECGAHNLERAKFCVACRAQLIRACPNCGQMTSLVATGNCWECGASFERAAIEQHASDLQARLNEIDVVLSTASERAAKLREPEVPWQGLSDDFDFLSWRDFGRDEDRRAGELQQLEQTLMQAEAERQTVVAELGRLERALGSGGSEA